MKIGSLSDPEDSPEVGAPRAQTPTLNQGPSKVGLLSRFTIMLQNSEVLESSGVECLEAGRTSAALKVRECQVDVRVRYNQRNTASWTVPLPTNSGWLQPVTTSINLGPSVAPSGPTPLTTRETMPRFSNRNQYCKRVNVPIILPEEW